MSASATQDSHNKWS